MASGKALAGPREGHAAGRLHRPLPLLLLEAEGAVVGGDDLQRVLREALPELFLMPFFAERRSEDVFRAFKTGRVHILERKIQVLRTSFGVRGEAAVAGFADFFERIVTR